LDFRFLCYSLNLTRGLSPRELAGLGWYLHTIVPEDQLNDKISEYAEYIKLIIIALVIAAVVYFVVKSYLKKKNNKQD